MVVTPIRSRFLLHHVGPCSVFLFLGRQSQRPRRLQALGTHRLGFELRETERLEHVGIVASARTGSFSSLAWLLVQQPKCIFAGLAADRAELVEDLTFESPPRSLVAVPNS